MNKFEYLKNLKNCISCSNNDLVNIDKFETIRFKIVKVESKESYGIDKDKCSSYFQQLKILEDRLMTGVELIEFLMKFKEIPLWFNVTPKLFKTKETFVELSLSRRANDSNLNANQSECFPFRLKEEESLNCYKVASEKIENYKYIKSIIIVAFVFGIGYLLSFLKMENRIKLNQSFLVFVFIFFTIYTLIQKRFLEVESDYLNSQIVITYSNFLLNKKIRRKYRFLNYTFDQITTRSGFYYSLKIKHSGNKFFYLDSRDYGLNKEILLEIERYL